MDKQLIRNYFPGGNTCQGFYSLWKSNVDDLHKLIILKGGPGTGKSRLVNYLGKEMSKKGYETEYLWCSSDAESLDGVVFRGIGAGVIDGTAPHTRDPVYPGVVDKIYNLGIFWQETLLWQHRQEIIATTDLNKSYYPKVYEKLRLAKKHHDRLKELQGTGMNWEAVDKLTQDLITQVAVRGPLERTGRAWRRFAGAITPQGHVNFIDELRNPSGTTYILKGSPGTGKSTLADKIGQAALAGGYDVEFYHCAFDPDSIENIRIPALNFSIIDGNPPHEKTAVAGETEINMNEFMSERVQTRIRTEAEECRGRYAEAFQEAILLLGECKAVHDDLEKLYIQAMDFTRLNQFHQEVLAEILAYAADQK